MIKQTHKPIQLTKSMLINILRDMEAKHLKKCYHIRPIRFFLGLFPI